MFCTVCNKLLSFCSCAKRNAIQPPASFNLKMDGSVIGSINPMGVINAPGQPFHNMKADPFGRIPGTNFQIGPTGSILPK